MFFQHSGSEMAKPNYSFAKRQRDLAKKQKQEEKRRKKAEGPLPPGTEAPEELPAPPATDTGPA
jgi:hypothetical protein